MTTPRIVVAAALLAVVAAAAWYFSRPAPRAETRAVTIVAEFPHDPEAWTQGLVFEDGVLYESTGLEGKSSLRRVALETGEVLDKVDLDATFFGEGLASIGDRLVVLTWRNQRALVFRKKGLLRVGTHKYRGEGWGLTFDGKNLIMSDGSDELSFRDPETFEVVRKVTVKDGDLTVSRLNELEYVSGRIFANVWESRKIIEIDPTTGRVTAWYDLSAVVEKSGAEDPRAHVLNGIAYDATSGRLFVTGKFWPKLFEISLDVE